MSDEIKEIKIITLGDIFENIETKEKAFRFKDYVKNLQDENERLNNIINRARKKLGEYKHYSTPTKEQNKENEDISDEVYQILHENLYELKEGNK